MPKINLTDAAVKRLKLPAADKGSVDYWDSTLRGLGLRISSSGRRTFNVQVKVLRDGRRRDTRIKLGVYPEISLAEARALAIEYKRVAAEGLDPILLRQAERNAQDKKSAHLSETTFATVRELFLQAHLHTLRPKTAAEYRRALTKNFAQLDALPLENIDTDMVQIILDNISGPYAANRSHSHIRVFFDWAVKRRILPSSPVTGIAKLHKEETRDHFLTEMDINLLWAAAGDEAYPFGNLFKVLLLTGQRLREVAGMRRENVDFDKAVWTLPGSMTKNKELHTVPLSDQVIDILQNLPHVGNTFMFTTMGDRPISGFERPRDRIAEAANVTGWRWHDLRRTLVTYCAGELDTQQAVTEAIINHKSGSTAGISGIYNRARYTKQKAAALQAWANLVDRITGETDADNVVKMR